MSSITLERTAAFISMLLVVLASTMIAFSWSSWQALQGTFLLLQFFAVLLLLIGFAPKQKRTILVVSWVGFAGSVAIWLTLIDSHNAAAADATADSTIVAVVMMAFFAAVFGYSVFAHMPVLKHEAKANTRGEAANESTNANRS